MAHDDLLAKAGIRVGNPAERRLINDEPAHQFVVKGFKNRGSFSRAGSQSSPRENLLRSLGIPDEGALEKATLYGNDGDLEYVPDTYAGQERYHPGSGDGIQATRQEVLDTHGEHFHSDIDPDVERILSEVTEAGTHFDYTRPFGRSMGAFDGDDDGDDNTEDKEEEEKEKPKAKDVKKAEKEEDGEAEPDKEPDDDEDDQEKSLSGVLDDLTKGYEGFKKLEGELSHEKGVKDPGAVAAAIGRKKYGKGKFQHDAAAGKKMSHEKVASMGAEDALDDLIKAGSGEGSRGGKVIGHTVSGKPVYSHRKPDEYKNFTPADHASASRIHNYHPYGDEEHHTKMADAHWDVFVNHERSQGRGKDMRTSKETIDSLKKENLGKSSAGEGSKGGQVIGHTRSGKPIYAHDSAIYAHGTQAFGGYGKGDHFDAYTRHSNDLKYKRGHGGKKSYLSAMKLHSQAYYAAKSEHDPDLPDLLKSDSVIDDLFKAVGGEGSRGGVVVGHTSGGKPIYQGETHSTRIHTTTGEETSHVNSYIQHAGDERPYGGENYHVFYQRKGAQTQGDKKTDADRDYVGYVIHDKDEGTWSGHPQITSMSARKQAKNFKTRGEAEHHILSTYQRYQEASKPKDQKAASVQEANDLYKALMDISLNKATDAQEDKVHQVMHEFKEGTLHSGSKTGPKVKNRKQAIAIAMNQSGQSNKSDDEASDLLKSRIFPIGTVHTFGDGKQYKKVADNEWHPVKGEGPRRYDYAAAADHNSKIEVGQHVRVNWTAGSFGHYTGKGTVTKVNAKSVAVALDEPVADQSGLGGSGYPAGHRIVVPRADTLSGANSKWAWHNGVFPVHDEGKKSSIDELLDLVKGRGEGSRGGKVIGHTRSGKPVYQNKSPDKYLDFTRQDHADAAAQHRRNWHDNQSSSADVSDSHAIDHERLSLDPKELASRDAKRRSAFGMNKSPSARNSFIKAAGPGGVLFDFGYLTGNPAADRYSELANQHAEPQQAEILKAQKAEYDQVLVEYVTTGRTREQDVSPQQDADVQKSEEQHGAQTADVSKPVFMGDFRTQFESKQARVGSEVVKAQSETDQAVIEMFGKNLGDAPTDMTMAGKTPVVLDLASGAAIDMRSGEQIQPAE